MEGPLLKVERADYHIRELEGIFRRYIRTNIKAMRPKKNRHKWKANPARLGTRWPRHLPAVIGDAIHNLRVSLDHAYWIMVEDNGGVWQKTVKFPFGGDVKSIKGALNGYPATAKPNDTVLKFILDDLQPFPGGIHELYDLHSLDITDKHKLLIPNRVGIRITDTDRVRMFRVDGAPIDLVGEAGGSVLISGLAGSGDSLFEAPALEYTGNLQDALSILFGEGEFENRPVLDTLRTLRESVTGAVKGLAELHSSAAKT